MTTLMLAPALLALQEGMRAGVRSGPIQRNHLKTVHFRHLHIEEDQVGFLAENRGNGALPIFALASNLCVGTMVLDSSGS